MWTCPTCKRTFKNMHQEHSCFVTHPDSHFLNKDEAVRAVYLKLLEVIEPFGAFTVNSVKHAILLTAGSHFLAIKPKRKWLDIEFVLPYEADAFPVHKTVKAGKTRWAHFMRLESEIEIDEQLVSWLKESYDGCK